MDHWIQGFRKAKTIQGEEKVLVPGDPEREMEIIRMKEGIPLLPVVQEDLNALGTKLGIDTSIFNQ